jgi:hypothetical protein
MSKLPLRIFDGSRKLFSVTANFLVTITDGNQMQHLRDYFSSSALPFELPLSDNPGDNYTVVVWAEDYKQAGFTSVLLSDAYEKNLDIMLVQDDPGFSFAGARWDAIAPLSVSRCRLGCRGGRDPLRRSHGEHRGDFGVPSEPLRSGEPPWEQPIASRYGGATADRGNSPTQP